MDAHALFQRIAALSEPQARMQALMGSPLQKVAAELLRKADLREGDFWQADHKHAVADGGGESTLDNFQTLCTTCHTAKTSRENATRKRKQEAQGSGDLRSFFRQ